LPGRYRCARNDATRICSAGGVNAPRADEYVTAAFLERARFYLLHGDGQSFIAERQWELANPDERRMLLAAVIRRVIIQRLEPEHEHPGRAGRALRIEWKGEPGEVQPPPQAKGVKGTGRARVLARDQPRDLKAERRRERRGRARTFANGDDGHPLV
jgi:hypothetical protein